VYGVIALPDATFSAIVGILVCLLIVVTGWQSFGIVSEEFYNDILLMIDLSLLAAYWLLIYFCCHIGNQSGAPDVSIYLISGMIFLLYAIWDVTALVGSDTKAFATVAHLSRFAVITFLTALVFFGIGIIVTCAGGQTGPIFSLGRIIALIIWSCVLLWWQAGKFIAAARDAKSGD